MIHTEHLIILAFMEINLRIEKFQLPSIESVVNGSHFTPFHLSWNALWSVGFSSECAVRLATDGLLVLSLSLKKIGDHIMTGASQYLAIDIFLPRKKSK